MQDKQPCRPVTRLPEWKTCELPGVVLSDNDRRLVASLKGVTVDELRTGVRVSATSSVGVIRFETFDVHIVPKLAGGNGGLVDLITFTHGLDTLKRVQARRALQLEPNSQLFHLVALLFAELCEALLRDGLLQDYVEQEAELTVLRGRLLVGDQVRHPFVQVDL